MMESAERGGFWSASGCGGAGEPLPVSPCVDVDELTLCVWAKDTAVAWGC